MLLGVLTSGIHQLTIKADNSSYQDTVIRPLNVLNSYFEKDISKFYEGQIGINIGNNSKGYTKLTFNSYGKGKFYNELKSMSYQWGSRIDQKGTKVIATKLLNENFAEQNEIPEFQAEKYQSYTGGIKLLPYSTEELEISSISANLFGEGIFNKDSLKGYFYSSMSDEKSDVSRIVRSLYGLSAYHEPILIKLQKIKDDANLNLKDKIFVALALDVLGAKEDARAYYDDKIKNSIEIKSEYAYIKGLKGDEVITTTALVAALAASLEKPEANQLYSYVEQNYPKETLINFEKLLYVKNSLSKLDNEKISFEYNYGNKKEKKTLDNGEIFSITLSPDELKTFSLSSVKGKLGVVAEYKEEFSPDLIVKDENLSINRSYEVEGIVTKEFKEGDKVLVRLMPQFNTNALNGSYQIVDYLPSGLRPIDQDWESYVYGGKYREYPVEINDQKVTFVVDKGNPYQIYYYARVVSKGTYRADPAILQSLKSLESITISNEDSVIIK